VIGAAKVPSEWIETGTFKPVGLEVKINKYKVLFQL
jgi:hypothetical protein